MRWIVHGERWIYQSEWVSLSLIDVEIPGDRRFEHHAVRMPYAAAGTVVHDPDRGLLMLWRHRLITDTWGWEIPAGRIDPGESPAEAAAREAWEETGWRPGPVEPLVSYNPSNGSSDQRFHVFLARGAQYVGAPVDATEAERVEWRTIEQVRASVRNGEIGDGLSLTAVLYAFQFADIT